MVAIEIAYAYADEKAPDRSGVPMTQA